MLIDSRLKKIGLGPPLPPYMAHGTKDFIGLPPKYFFHFLKSVIN